MSKILSLKLLKFLISGGTAAVIEYGVFSLLSVVVHIEVLYANSISFCCGLVVSYALNRRWVFKSEADKRQEFSAYSILALVNIVLSNIAIFIFVHIITIEPLIAKLLSMAMIAAWNYLIFSKVIFKKK